MDNPRISRQQHLQDWFTLNRKKLIRCSELDRRAGRPIGTFSRFLALDPEVPLTHTISTYYPALIELGYFPPL